MPGHMDKGTKNYRNMMKRMEEGMGEEKVPASMNMGMESIKTLGKLQMPLELQARIWLR